jgi:hypothetical protein
MSPPEVLFEVIGAPDAEPAVAAAAAAAQPRTRDAATKKRGGTKKKTAVEAPVDSSGAMRLSAFSPAEVVPAESFVTADWD